MNTNCLAGMKCPRCQSEEPFLIQAEGLVQAFDEGVEPADYPNYEWDEDNFCRCGACGHTGIVRDFRC